MCRRSMVAAALVLGGVLGVQAYERELNPRSLREAWFLGKDTTFRSEQFYKDYSKTFPVPETGVHVERIEIVTPFKELADRARRAPDAYNPAPPGAVVAGAGGGGGGAVLFLPGRPQSHDHCVAGQLLAIRRRRLPGLRPGEGVFAPGARRGGDARRPGRTSRVRPAKGWGGGGGKARLYIVGGVAGVLPRHWSLVAGHWSLLYLC